MTENIIRERLMRSDYARYRRVASLLDPLKTLNKQVAWGCPVCRRVNGGELEHGATVCCGGCGLSVTAWGNSLDCWISAADLAKARSTCASREGEDE